eukprot:scaffold10724_cov150-Isochrysis_galbana.AAC.3
MLSRKCYAFAGSNVAMSHLHRWLLTFSPNGCPSRRSTPASATSATLGFTPNHRAARCTAAARSSIAQLGCSTLCTIAQ